LTGSDSRAAVPPVSPVFDDYLGLLRRIHEHVRPSTYVEVGVHEGDSLALVAPGTRSVGIDPTPSVRHRLPPGTRVLQQTSDEAFSGDELSQLLDGRPVALAFIDGLHLFESALRDFIALERRCTPASTILVHDCYPRDEVTSSRDRTTVFWSGDVWKLVLCLAEYRPDLSVAVVDVAPTGVAIVRGLDPGSQVLSRSYEELCARFVGLGYDAVADDKPRRLRLVPGDWPTVRALLAAGEKSHLTSG
jgi:hypothetical protein